MAIITRIFLAICLLGISTHGFSQMVESEETTDSSTADSKDGWELGGTTALGVNHVSLTNWAAGGQNSISINGLLNLFAHYKKRKALLENYFDVGYGSIHQGKNADWVKTDDKIDFTSKFGRVASGKWYIAGLLNFKTQMAPGYNYPNDSVLISDALAPAYLLVALGMDYKPGKGLTFYISPLTSKITIVNDQALANAGSFGVEAATYDAAGNELTPGKNVRAEVGGSIRMFVRKEVVKNISVQTKLDLFSNYVENPQNIDVSWEVLISMKVNKFFAATLSTHLIYDDDIDIAVDSNGDGVYDTSGPRVQFKEVLALGFSYQF